MKILNLPIWQADQVRCGKWTFLISYQASLLQAGS